MVRPLTSYALITLCMVVLALCISSFETWVTPAMMQWVTPMLL